MNQTNSEHASSDDVRAVVDDNGVAHVPAFAIPPSEFASDAAREAFIARGPLPELDLDSIEKILRLRAASDAYRRRIAEEMQKDYPVTVTPEVIGGVQTDVVARRESGSPKNRERVLLNLHGGGMLFGARYEGQVASIPIASIGDITVITVDYRMAPEHRFPAATEDVAAVYEALLARYEPTSIGIYGHSAGAALTAQAVVWFDDHGLPRPGAIGLDGCGAAWGKRGDSAYFGGAFMWGIPRHSESRDSGFDLYYQGVDVSNPLVCPAFFPEVLAKFPPTLVTNATRDPTLSDALYTHRQLVRAGVPAELHVWEGMWHSFHYDHKLPESRDSYEVLIRFFETHLT